MSQDSLEHELTTEIARWRAERRGLPTIEIATGERHGRAEWRIFRVFPGGYREEVLVSTRERDVRAQVAAFRKAGMVVVNR